MESTGSDRLSRHTRLGQILLRVDEQKYHSYTTVIFGRFGIKIIGRGMDK